MAVSAFKSTSRRGNLSTTTAPAPPSAAKPSPSTGQVGSGESTRKAKVQPRRSRSVSAFPRAHLDLDLDFTNTRDNPLYWAADSPPSDGDGASAAKPAKLDEVDSRPRSSGPDSKALLGCGGERRGRTVSRDLAGSEGKSSTATGGGGGRGVGVGRSLSRVDTGRRKRSVSRVHYGRNFETEQEQDCNLVREKCKTNVNGIDSNPEDKPMISRSNSDLAELLNGLRTWPSQHPAENSDDSAINQCSLFTSYLEGGSMSSFSDADERGFKPVPELTKLSHLSSYSATGHGAIDADQTEGKGAGFDMHDYENVVRKSNSSSTITIIVDSPPELVNPGEAESVIGIRGEYARKLEESQERARKLRAELAVEVHRGVELNKILKEIIPCTETPDVKKIYAVTKASVERRKVSRRLEEEAMAYFDECVSISTFDGSDFSLEDPPVPSNASTGISEPDNLSNLASRETSTLMANCSVQNLDPSSLIMPSNAASPSTANSIINKSPPSISPNGSRGWWKRRFSFSDKQDNGSDLEHEIRNYVKAFAKGGGGIERARATTTTRMGRSVHHNTDDYTLLVPGEKLLLERTSLRNRIESGGVLLCKGGDVGFPFSPLSCVL